MPVGIIAEPPVTPSKKARRRAFDVAVLAVQRRVALECEPLPFTEIEGRAAPGPFSDDGTPTRSAIRRWTRLVAADMAKRFPDDSDAAMEFTFRHSLSIS